MDEHSEWLRVGNGFRCMALGCSAGSAALVRRRYVNAYQEGTSTLDNDNDNFVCKAHSGLSDAEIARLPFAGPPFRGDEDGSIGTRYDELLQQSGLVEEAPSGSRTTTLLFAVMLLAGFALVALFFRGR
jgi:hypothetical protein